MLAMALHILVDWFRNSALDPVLSFLWFRGLRQRINTGSNDSIYRNENDEIKITV